MVSSGRARARKVGSMTENSRDGAARLRNAWSGAKDPQTVPSLMATLIFASFLIIYFVSQGYVSWYQIEQVVLTNGLTLVLGACGLTLVVLSGELDLAGGAIISLANVLLALHLNGGVVHDLGLMLLVVGIAVAAGLVNGLGVVFLGLPAVVLTIGSSFVYSGVALLLLSQPVGLSAEAASGPIAVWTSSGVMPVSAMVLAVVLAGWWLFTRTRGYFHLLAIGSDATSAKMNGISERRVKLLSFAAAGAFYGMAGVFLTSQISSADTGLGATYLLGLFAALVLGGTRMSGGRGSLYGTALGGMSITILASLLVSVGVASYWGPIAEGAILLVAVAIISLTERADARTP